ncbi:hypothetical protein BTVI_26745 [Pitangus sulphuratus]|nr:hypothetical protein BTVI_26745 [Pitangus sulphuratus]
MQGLICRPDSTHTQVCGQVMWKEYTDAGYHCRKKIHAAKAQLELKLVRNVRDTKISVFKYITDKRQCRNNIIPLQDEDSHLTNRDRNKVEVFNATFTSVFSMDDGRRGSQFPDLEDHDCENDQLPVDSEIVWDLLLQLEPYKCMGPAAAWCLIAGWG